MEYRDQDFNGGVYRLDGNTFSGCTFRNCVIQFGAEAPLHLTATHFKDGVKWQLIVNADYTLRFLRSLYLVNEGGAEVVNQILESVRGPGSSTNDDFLSPGDGDSP